MGTICMAIVFSPLLAALIVGLLPNKVGRSGAHWITNSAVALSFFLSLIPFVEITLGSADPYNGDLYTWLESGGIEFKIGFLIDELSATMMLVVTFISWMVHIYTIGYMRDDPGYQRFFSYISLFTFSMLILVMSNNFLQLFFGWEAVGLVSYLLIGFWYTRDTAIKASLKAFLVNRVGDFGFLLGIAAILAYFGSLDYETVFGVAANYEATHIKVFSGSEWSLMTVICCLLFIGAMGKSAQVPLHVWLPDSMEGPTPISALIHAATMVTAGIFMVARMSPLFELSTTALSVVLVVGAVTAFFMGLLGLVQHDIKRVVAYSTLSQLGYMTVALGASAYAAAMFHLFTHAFFKALLFLAAGSVIVSLHHEQDMRRMGGLKRYLPITYWTSLVGTLALIGCPGFSGFFSKDGIIEAVRHSTIPGSGFAYLAVLSGVLITSLYSFRLFFLVFHGKERFDVGNRKHLHESPAVIWIPLVALALPSISIGWFTMEPMLFGAYFDQSIVVAAERDVLGTMASGYHGIVDFTVHGLQQTPFLLGLAGFISAWYLYIRRPDIPPRIADFFGPLYRLLVNKYGFDRLNEWFFAGGALGTGRVLWRFGDETLIDGVMVNGSARTVGRWSGVARRLQSGYLYHYAFAMILGLLVLLGLFVHRVLT